MKKTLAIISLVMVIAVSLLAGTLAVYTATIDNLASGSVTAKEFVLLENGSDTFVQNVKIAPSETVKWQFGVKNYDGTAIAETAMDLDFTVDIGAAAGKAAIEPLTVTVRNEADEIVGTKTGSGPIVFKDGFALSGTGQSHTYTVEVSWPSNDATDINYAGAGFGNALTVKVTGTQK
jgi:hypothetical protein